MKVCPCSSSASPSVSQFMLLKKMCEIARTASSRRAIVIWPTTEEPDRITALEARKTRINIVQTVEVRLTIFLSLNCGIKNTVI